MKRFSLLFFFFFVSQIVQAQATSWRGKTDVLNAQEVPNEGFFARSNEFSRNSILQVENLLSKKTVLVRVIGPLVAASQSALVALSPKAANTIQVGSGDSVVISIYPQEHTGKEIKSSTTVKQHLSKPTNSVPSQPQDYSQNPPQAIDESFQTTITETSEAKKPRLQRQSHVFSAPRILEKEQKATLPLPEAVQTRLSLLSRKNLTAPDEYDLTPSLATPVFLPELTATEVKKPSLKIAPSNNALSDTQSSSYLLPEPTEAEIVALNPKSFFPPKKDYGADSTKTSPGILPEWANAEASASSRKVFLPPYSEPIDSTKIIPEILPEASGLALQDTDNSKNVEKVTDLKQTTSVAPETPSPSKLSRKEPPTPPSQDSQTGSQAIDFARLSHTFQADSLDQINLRQKLDSGGAYVQIAIFADEQALRQSLDKLRSFVPLTVVYGERGKSAYRLVADAGATSQLGVVLMHFKSQGFRQATIVKG